MQIDLLSQIMRHFLLQAPLTKQLISLAEPWANMDAKLVNIVVAMQPDSQL
jgi:hypothetical protein